MAEQTFKSPGFFEREIEVISRPLTRNTSTPVGVIGPAKKGQAFVPKTVTSVDEFIREFGMPDQDTSAAHAIAEFFSEGGKSATFCRVLGTGSSNRDGSVGFAGFKVDGEALQAGESDTAKGAVQFIVAQHKVNDAEHVTYGIFNDNDSISTAGDSDPDDGVDVANDDKIQLVRAMIFMHKDYSMQVANSGSEAKNDYDLANISANNLFNLNILNVSGPVATQDSIVKSYTVSLDPSSDQYITKVLNTDSFSFTEKLHFLYADFPVDDELASTNDQAEGVAILRGDDSFLSDGTTPHLDAYGDFTARFEAPRTTSFISQPFGTAEYDLFHFESLDDGSYASGDYKISIADLKASTEKNYKYGTFSVQLRKIDDTDDAPVILESYSRCNLDPDSPNYVARLIGDQKISLSLDVDSDDEKRLVREGTFSNKSTRVRIVMAGSVSRREVPETSLPFGFRGIPSLRTTKTGKDGLASSDGTDGKENSLLLGRDNGTKLFSGDDDSTDKLSHSILPPLPFRSKVTKGSMTQSGDTYFQTFFGQVKDGDDKKSRENVKTSLYWGLHTSKVKSIDKPNDAGSLDFNPLIKSLTKYLGKISDVKFSGIDADKFNNNKFSLAKVVFPVDDVANLSGSVFDAFLEAVYIRNADVDKENLYDPVKQVVKMAGSQDPFDDEETSGVNKEQRASMAQLLAKDPVKFNKYSLMAKFTAPFYGGFDGLNMLDRDDYFMTDRAASTVAAGDSADGQQGHAASGGYESGLAGTELAGNNSMQGEGLNNNVIMSYRNAVRLMTDELVIDHNVLVVPGIRDSLITDFAARRVRDYGKAIYLMDIPHFDVDTKRIFVSSRGVASGVSDVEETSIEFNTREVDSSYVAAYYPDVMLRDSGDDENAKLTNQRRVRVPSSVVALGALARTDRLTQPWFAPAGFSRGALDRVVSLDVRLNAADRDTLYEANINPIANFPNNQFVIFGQKTTQIARTALDRVNVRRLMINIKRRIQKIAQGLLFEQNDAATRNRFIAQASAVLADVRVKQGIEDFRVIMDDTNNTAEDVDNNRLNGRIVVVPTRAVEFIAMDFIITNSGVEFPS